MQAQAGKGTITGSVTDPAQGALQGARIEVEGTGLTAVSDAQGLFMIVEVPEGKRTVKVSYVGFSDFSTDVSVTAGAMTQVDVTLKVGGVSQDVEVRAGRERGEVEHSIGNGPQTTSCRCCPVR